MSVSLQTAISGQSNKQYLAVLVFFFNNLTVIILTLVIIWGDLDNKDTILKKKRQIEAGKK